MDTIEALMTRRSIRKFKTKKVSEEALDKILRAAMQAPSARNQQPWHFIVVDDKEILERMSEIHPYMSTVRGAPLAIVVCGDLSLEMSKGMWMLDCTNAAMSILLAAHALHLGAVWIAAYPREERVGGIKKLFDLPESVIPLCVIPIGYADEKKEVEQRFKEDRVHRNGW